MNSSGRPDHLGDMTRQVPALAVSVDTLAAMVACVSRALRGGRTLFVCGNGGSAADAEHIVGELAKGFLLRRSIPEEMKRRLLAAGGEEAGGYLANRLQGGLRAISLVGHPALATAVGNDTAMDMVFAQQVYAFGRAQDVLMGLSTSGNARNVVLAAHTARAIGMQVVALTGRGGGELGALADISVRVPAELTHRVQEYHVVVYHTFCALLEEEFYGTAIG